MRRIKLIGWFIVDHRWVLAGVAIGTALLVYVSSPVVGRLVTAITAAFE